MRGLAEQFSTSSLYSGYRNDNDMATAGLTSNFGIDSPSFSRTGSFPRSTRKAGVFPGVPDRQQYPASDCYQQISRETATSLLSKSPRATIGNSKRETAQYVAPAMASGTPGV